MALGLKCSGLVFWFFLVTYTSDHLSAHHTVGMSTLPAKWQFKSPK